MHHPWKHTLEVWQRLFSFDHGVYTGMDGSNFWVCRDRTLGQFCQAGDGEIIDCAKLANELFHYVYLHVLKPSCIILKETYIISRNGIIKRWVSFTIRIKSNLIHFTGSRFARTWVSIRTGSVTLWSENNAKHVPKNGFTGWRLKRNIYGESVTSWYGEYQTLFFPGWIME